MPPNAPFEASRKRCTLCAIPGLAHRSGGLGVDTFLGTTGLLTGCLALAFAGLTGLILRRLTRSAPVDLDARAQSDFTLPVFEGLTATAFQSGNDQGAFGEALTFILMAQDGWRPVNAKPGSGPQGLDGLFIKTEGLGWRARLIETKTNSSRYTAASMADAKILADLDQLYVTTANADLQTLYTALAAGIRNKVGHIRRELWRHRLSTGVCEITALGRDGRRRGHPALRSVRIEMEGLRAAVGELDRKSVIFKPHSG